METSLERDIQDNRSPNFIANESTMNPMLKSSIDKEWRPSRTIFFAGLGSNITTSEIVKKHMGPLLDALQTNLLIQKYWRDYSPAEKQVIPDECFDRDTYSIDGPLQAINL